MALGFQASDAWRLYARVSQGYKPGGFNLAPTSLADAEAYGRERSTSLELGARVLFIALLMLAAAMAHMALRADRVAADPLASPWFGALTGRVREASSGLVA